VSRESVVDTWIKAANLDHRILAIQRDLSHKSQPGSDDLPLDSQERGRAAGLAAFLSEVSISTSA
jgi:hypothetical protein